MRSHFCSVWDGFSILNMQKKCKYTFYLLFMYIFAYRKRIETKIKLFSFTETRDSTKLIEFYKFLAHAYFAILQEIDIALCTKISYLPECITFI